MRRRNTLATLLLIFILLALPAVAAIQTIWLTSASRGEADRMRRGLSNATRQIRADLSLELSSMMTLLAPQIQTRVEGEAADMAQLSLVFPGFYSSWKDQSRFPGLIETILYVGPLTEWQEYRYNPETTEFEPADSEVSESEELTVTIPLGKFVEVVSGLDGGASGFNIVDPGALVVHLDRDYLASVVIPELVETYMGAGGGEYTVCVAEISANEILWTNSVTQRDAAIETCLQGADEIVSLTPWVAPWIPELRSFDEEIGRRLLDPSIQTWLSFRPPSEDVPEGASAEPNTIPDGQPRDNPARDANTNGEPDSFLRSGAPNPGELYLVVRHESGSIEAAARLGLKRNLALSYVALTVLVGAAIAYYLLFRRANRQREREHEFVATVTHELRTPVAAIHAVADNLAEGIVTDPARVREYGGAMLDEGRRLRTMIDQVLLYAGLQGGVGRRAFSDIKIDGLVERICIRVPELRRDNLTVRVEPNLPSFRGDATAVESILRNLLSNAAKHNPEGTRVNLTIRSDHGASGLRARSGFNLVVEVADNGRGIPRNELRKVREPFFRGAQSQADQIPGSGLGLSLVRRIVRVYNGSMIVESAPGRGTTVTVRLPFEHGVSDESENTDR